MTSHSSPEAAQADPASAEVCSTKAAASLLGVSHRTVQLWVENGVLQAWKTAGGHRRILLTSLQRLVDQRNRAVAGARSGPPTATTAPAGRRIVMTDDDPALLRLAEREIAGWGLEARLVTARDGFDALIRIGETRPDLLISDLNLTGLDGFRMVRTLRADARYAGMAIIVISALDRATIASMGLPADIPVLSKPVSFPELRARIEQLFAVDAPPQPD